MTLFSTAGLGARLVAQRAAAAALAVTGDDVARLTVAPWKHDPYPTYARLRGRAPIQRSRTGVLVAAHHETCNQILRERRFGVRPPDGHDVPPWVGAVFDDEQQAVFMVPSFLELDPPEHTRLRALARPAFSAGRITGYRQVVESVTDDLLTRARRRGRFDLVADFANPLPIAVITSLLGIPDVDAERFGHYGRVVGASLDGVRSIRHARALARATADLHALFTTLMKQRRADPGDDVISQLTMAHDEGKLTAAELVATCELLLIAGFETTVNLITNAVDALLSNPGQWEVLCAQPELASAAVEETLRFDPPVQITSRFAQDDVEVGGRPLPRSSFVMLLLGATGRDDRVYSRAAEFDITRTPERDHLAFSSGIHYCLGAPLARMEATVALTALVRHAPDLHRVSVARRRPTFVLRGFSVYPVASGRVGPPRPTRGIAATGADDAGLTGRTAH